MNIISAHIPDSLAGTFPEKLALLRRLKLSYLEQSFEELPLESISLARVYAIRDLLIDEGCSIHLYKASPNLKDPDMVRHLLYNAHLLDIDSILFDLSGFSSEEADYCLKAAESMGIAPLIENRADSAFRDPDAILDFFEQHPQNECGLVFNPLEFVKTGRHPFFHVYYASRIKGKIAGLRVNDGLYLDGSPMLPGNGNGEVKELISIMKARSFQGFFSITPYMPGQKEEDLFTIANWLRETLKHI